MEVEMVYRQFHAELLGYVKSKIASREEAEDIVQNVFIKISANLDKLEEQVKLKNWIFTITRNSIIDHYRVKAKMKKKSVTLEMTDAVFMEEDPDSTKGLEQCIDGMIRLLPQEYRDVIMESELNGVKQKDLAKKFGVPYSSLRSKVQRGRERLKQLFYNCCYIETDKLGNVLEVQAKYDCGCNSCASRK